MIKILQQESQKSWEHFEDFLEENSLLNDFGKFPEFIRVAIFQEFISKMGFQVSQEYQFAQTQEYPVWSIWSQETGFYVFREKIEDAIVTFFRALERSHTPYKTLAKNHHLGI